MEDEVIKKYCCNFCTNKRKCNCLKILKEKKNGEYIYKCTNYEYDHSAKIKKNSFDYNIKSNKKR